MLTLLVVVILAHPAPPPNSGPAYTSKGVRLRVDQDYFAPPNPTLPAGTNVEVIRCAKADCEVQVNLRATTYQGFVPRESLSSERLGFREHVEQAAGALTNACALRPDDTECRGTLERVAALAKTPAASAQEPVNPSSPLVVQPGDHGDLPLENGAEVLALCGDRLTVTRARVAPTKDGRELAADCEAKFLVRDVPGLKAGEVRVATLVSTDLDRGVEVTLHERRYGSRQEPTQNVVVRREPAGSSGFRLVLESSSGREVLYETVGADDGHAEVLWAGDLNADGRLDFLLQASNKRSVRALRLLLSAPRSGPPREVASFLTPVALGPY